jgi:hypothetical protein
MGMLLLIKGAIAFSAVSFSIAVFALWVGNSAFSWPQLMRASSFLATAFSVFVLQESAKKWLDLATEKPGDIWRWMTRNSTSASRI